MPVAAKMNPFVYQFNFLTLGQAVFKQRLWEKGAQGNTVRVVQGMYELCNHIDSELWGTFYEYVGTPSIEWSEVRKRLKKKNYTLDDLYNDTLNKVDENTSVVDYLLRKFGEQKTMWE
jgi:hypothetical protein